jgi:hypothetical protein
MRWDAVPELRHQLRRLTHARKSFELASIRKHWVLVELPNTGDWQWFFWGIGQECLPSLIEASSATDHGK